MERTKRTLPGWLRSVLWAILGLAVLIWFFTALTNVGTGQGEAGRQQLENAIRRGAVVCYAAEGMYPPNIDYLRQHYGLQIDESRYDVHYEIFAENLMPEITVLVREG